MPFQTHNPRSTDLWTEDRIILLLKLDAENILSRSQIANELAKQTGSKFSRNAVIGKLARLGAPPKGKPPKKIPQSRVRIRTVKFYTAQPVSPPQPIALQPALGLGLCDLTDQTCRYPVHEEGAQAAFCGHPVSQRSYCAAHYAICYYQPREARPDQSHRIRLINARRFRSELLKPKCEAAA